MEESKDTKDNSEKFQNIENFEKIIKDMMNDFTTTFPEYSNLWEKWNHLDSCENKQEELEALYAYCASYYPEKFFDILYSNEDLFDVNNTNKTAFFLPNVDFKILFHCEGISEKTRKIMWNYLQLILMTIINSVDSKDDFGDFTKTMFEGIDETELFSKLNETMQSMGEFFQSFSENMADESTNETPDSDTKPNENTHPTAPTPTPANKEDDSEEESDDEGNKHFFKNMPNIKDICEHIKTLFNGKIGSLAKELAEEISKDTSELFGTGEGENKNASTKDVINSLLKNPEKMTTLIKTVSEKLNTKLSSGEISKDELIKEATDILGKMKGMGDGKQFQEMFKNITKMAGMGGNTKFNMNAFQQMSKQSSMREKLKQRMLEKKKQQVQKYVEQMSKIQQQQQQQQQSSTLPPSPPPAPTPVPSEFETETGEGGGVNHPQKKKKSKKSKK